LVFQGKLIIFVAMGGLLAMLGGIVYYASLDNPKLQQAGVYLMDVKVIDVNVVERYAKLQTTFLVKNPTDKTFTVPLIAYKLFANGVLIGNGQYSTEDIAMPGRAAFYPNTEIPLTHIFRLVFSENIEEEYNNIVNNDKNIKFTADGIITLENAWSVVEKNFNTSL